MKPKLCCILNKVYGCRHCNWMVCSACRWKILNEDGQPIEVYKLHYCSPDHISTHIRWPQNINNKDRPEEIR